MAPAREVMSKRFDDCVQQTPAWVGDTRCLVSLHYTLLARTTVQHAYAHCCLKPGTMAHCCWRTCQTTSGRHHCTLPQLRAMQRHVLVWFVLEQVLQASMLAGVLLRKLRSRKVISALCRQSKTPPSSGGASRLSVEVRKWSAGRSVLHQRRRPSVPLGMTHNHLYLNTWRTIRLY